MSHMSCAQQIKIEHLNNVSDMRNFTTELPITKVGGKAENTKLLNSLQLPGSTAHTNIKRHFS